MHDEKRKIVRSSTELFFNVSSVASMLNVHQHNSRGIDSLMSNASTAEDLVNKFAEWDDVSYIYVTLHPDDGLVLLTRKQHNKQLSNIRKWWTPG